MSYTAKHRLPQLTRALFTVAHAPRQMLIKLYDPNKTSLRFLAPFKQSRLLPVKTDPQGSVNAYFYSGLLMVKSFHPIDVVDVKMSNSEHLSVIFRFVILLYLAASLHRLDQIIKRSSNSALLLYHCILCSKLSEYKTTFFTC